MLIELRPQKEDIWGQFQVIDLSQKTKQQRQQVVQGRIKVIHLEIARLQAELN